MERTNDPVHKSRLEDQGLESGLEGTTAEERLAMVWTLTVQAWLFRGERADESRLRRDVVRVLRRRG